MNETKESKADLKDMIHIPGGKFMMGSDIFYPEEKPEHEVTIDGFMMDKYLVTNEQYERFAIDDGFSFRTSFA